MTHDDLMRTVVPFQNRNAKKSHDKVCSLEGEISTLDEKIEELFGEIKSLEEEAKEAITNQTSAEVKRCIKEYIIKIG